MLQLVALDIEPYMAEFAGPYFAASGLGGRIRPVIGPAQDSLAQLAAEGERCGHSDVFTSCYRTKRGIDAFLCRLLSLHTCPIIECWRRQLLAALVRLMSVVSGPSLCCCWHARTHTRTAANMPHAVCLAAASTSSSWMPTRTATQLTTMPSCSTACWRTTGCWWWTTAS